MKKGPVPRLDEERFFDKVAFEPLTGCWLWAASLMNSGYGRFFTGGRLYRQNWGAHRWSYHHFKGEVPDDKVIDHLCRIKSCVNPDHLEVCTQRENIMRGDSHVAKNLAKTHCPRGHEYAGDNLHIMATTGHRRCRACNREDALVRYHRVKADNRVERSLHS